MGRLDSLLSDWHPFFSWNNKLFRICVFAFVFLILLTVLIVLAVHHRSTDPSTTTTADIEDKLKYDCHPDQMETDVNQIKTNCLDRGCRWIENDTVTSESLLPRCFYPPDFVNYQIDSWAIYGSTMYLIMNQTSKRKSGFENDVKQIKIEITEMDNDAMRIRIGDSERQRWEPPIPLIHHVIRKTDENKKYKIKHDNGILTITRRKGGSLIWKSDLKKVIFAEQFIQLIVDVPSESLYGLGDHLDQHLKRVTAGDANGGRKRLKFYNYGDLPMREKASYGTHPFYLMYDDPINNPADAHGVLLINSNAMDIIMTHTPSLTYRSIGGIFDFYILLGPTAMDVMRQKTQLIGQTPLPAYWSLGYHLCKYGYVNDAEINDTFNANINLGLPFDAQWADIDYMHEYNMFTYDRDNFGNLDKLIDHIHASGRHFVPILDPAVSDSEPIDSEAWKAYKDGLEMDIYIKDPSEQILRTKIWNTKYSILPDFTHPKASLWWKKQLKIFHDKIAFDGLWTDMNEPAVFINGMQGGCVNDSLDRPQFNPLYPMLLENVTICASAQHYIGSHYDVHNIYSLFEAKMTHEALTAIRHKRAFILSRATTTGQGMYTSHWLGDVDSSWDHLRLSIPLILDYNLFNIPLVGSDICGFVGNTTDQLCARWHAVGAFYTFVRNHNDHYFVKQDPASMGGIVLESAMNSLHLRYTLLPYLYTLFYQNSMYGDPVLRSLKFNFPQDPKTDANDQQFMWGDGLLINGILYPDVDNMTAYLPSGVWYEIIGSKSKIVSQGQEVTLEIPVAEINLMIRGGRVVPTTRADAPHDFNSTETQRKLPFTIIAALDQDGTSSGQLYWDDGDSLYTIDFEEYSLIDFDVRDQRLTSSPLTSGFKDEFKLRDVQIWGLERKPTYVTFEDSDGNSKNLTESMGEFTYDKGHQILKVEPFEEAPDEGQQFYHLNKRFTISWS